MGGMWIENGWVDGMWIVRTAEGGEGAERMRGEERKMAALQRKQESQLGCGEILHYSPE